MILQLELREIKDQKRTSNFTYLSSSLEICLSGVPFAQLDPPIEDTISTCEIEGPAEKKEAVIVGLGTS